MDPLSIAAVGWSISAVGWLMSSLVSKAVTALLEAWAKSNDLQEELKTLKDQLLQLDDLLTKARGLPNNNSSLKDLVPKLQQLTYRAENLLDELDYYRLQDKIQQRATQEKESSSNKSSVAQVPLPKTLFSERMNKLAEQLQKAKENVHKAMEIELLFKTACKTEATKLRQTSSFFTEPRVFGRDQEHDQLLKLLTNQETAIVGKVPVLAIFGSGGVGKTTLARLVFNDEKTHSYFQVRLWICVSREFDIHRLTCEMLEGACGTRCDLTNLNELQNKLKKELGSKRFLLVLDDMWEDKDKSQWDSMVAPLNNCMGNGSIILVTTRNQNVAKMVDAGDNIFHLKGLDENAFLSFFSTCIFNFQDPNYGGNWRLRIIGQQIASKLKGNPLAAKTVSAMLKENCDERYWIEIRDSEEWKSQNGPDDIMPALRLSYEHMPFNLQRCFSYCAIFPDDHPFICEELVYLWMAQGYLDVKSEEKTQKRMEDIGRAYFNDLFNRGFFQTIQSRYDNVVHYTFHDLIHYLACEVSCKECFSINGAETKKIPQTIRHLSIFNSTKKAETEKEIVTALACLEGENLGTIFNGGKLSSRISHSILDLLKETKFLHVVRLDLCGPVQSHNCNFQNFVSLRYLRLNMSDFNNRKTFPREICRLYHLEVLEIKDGHLLDELPNNFSDLVILRHFIVEGKLHSKIQGVGKLSSLQELNHFEVQPKPKKGFEIEQLGSLKEIGGSLSIWDLENVKLKAEASEARLEEKEKLDALYLKWNHGEQENQSVLEGLKPSSNLKVLEIHGYGGEASPTWLDPSLILLESLSLKNCKAWELLPPIGEFEFLKKLKLCGLPLREIGPDQCYGTRQSMKFQSLEELEIRDMRDLKKLVWRDQLKQFLFFKKLIKLTIRNCKTWELLPPIGELEFLKHLKLSGMAIREIVPLFYDRQSMKFLSLEELEIRDMPDLIKWVWTDQRQLLYFKKLKKLTIQGCPKLVDLPLSGSATSEVLDRFPSLEILKIEDCPLFQLPPLPYSSVLSIISIKRSAFIKSMDYRKADQELSLCLDKSLSRKVGELLAFHELSSLDHLTLSHIPCLESFHELSSLRRLDISHISSWEPFHENLFIPHLHILRISHISSLESLDLHSFVALEDLMITMCPSLTSLTFGDQLVCLKSLSLTYCKTVSSIKGLKSWVKLQLLEFHGCPGFIAAWDSALKEIQRTEPDFSLSLWKITSDSPALLTLPICKQLTSLRCFALLTLPINFHKYQRFYPSRQQFFDEEDEFSPQLHTSTDLVDIEGCKKFLQSFPFDLFPYLEKLEIKFHHIRSLTASSCNEITQECRKLRNIEKVNFGSATVQIFLKLRREEMICQ